MHLIVMLTWGAGVDGSPTGCGSLERNLLAGAGLHNDPCNCTDLLQAFCLMHKLRAIGPIWSLEFVGLSRKFLHACVDRRLHSRSQCTGHRKTWCNAVACGSNINYLYMQHDLYLIYCLYEPTACISRSDACAFGLETRNIMVFQCSICLERYPS